VAALTLAGAGALWFAASAPAREAHAQATPAGGGASERASYLETLPGSAVTLEMVAIPGGSFVMGSPDGEAGRSQDEGPAHEVTLSPFWMAKLETTWDQYEVFAFSKDVSRDRPTPATPAGVDAITRPTPPYADPAFGYGRRQQPAISMTHHAAMEFGRWLSAATGRTYRLPTEAEWEFACRAGTKAAYSFDDPKAIEEYAWYAVNSDAMPHPVGKKRPNAWGLHDLHGNVTEWTLDHYQADFYRLFVKGGAPPMNVPTERRYPHVVRGGSWDDEAPRLRSAARGASEEDWNRRDPQRPQSIWWLTNATSIGFRVVRPMTEDDRLKGLRSRVTKQSP